MSDELVLFDDNKFKFEEKFYFFMDLLVSNKGGSRTEQICFFLIFYTQIISIFFDSRLNVFHPKDNISDNILKYFYQIFRIAGIFFKHKNYYLKMIYIIFFIMIFITLFFILTFIKTQKNSIYNKSHSALNMIFKTFIFICYNIFLDFFSHLICFNSKENDYIIGLSCSFSNNIFPFLVSFISTIYSICVVVFILLFYNDSFYLSMNFYAQTCTNYNIYLILNCFLLSIMFSLIKHLTIELFLFINLFISIGFFFYYMKKIIYYDTLTNKICGIFHTLYIWTVIFCIIFKYLNVSEKGLIWGITSIIFSLTFLNLKNIFDEKLFFSEPYFKISNIDYLLYYIRKLMYMINYDSQDNELKSILTAIIQLHINECQTDNCIMLKKEKLYLPKVDRWSDNTKPFVLDDVFLSYFIIDINNYYITNNLVSPELLINLSNYYLNVIGNIIQSIYYLHKVKKMKLTIEERFFYKRLKITISKKLFEKFKYANEVCEHLDELNPSYYYKYEYYKEQFYNSIFKDLELLKTFWEKFSVRENNNVIDYNEIYLLTEKIMLCKLEIENLWKQLFSLYSGINEVFDFYIDYVDQINDDSFLKMNLDSIKRKTENSTEHINLNFYNIMFNKETGIAICNGDIGKEGLIEKVNHSFEKIFKFTFDEMRGMNISLLMPKVFEKDHYKFMKEYTQIGKKHLLNAKGHHSFAKDKNNSIIYIKINLKIFPVLNKSIYFIGMVIPEKIDDLIFIDSNFIIQGMSKKLTEKFQINNKYFFMNYNIPFYMICKNFIHFYKTFMQENNEQKNESIEFNKSFQEESDIESTNNEKKKDINIEINENIELEYEIKIPNFILKFEKISKNENLYQYHFQNELTVNNTYTENHIEDSSINISFEENYPLINSTLNPMNINSIIKNKSTLKHNNKNNDTPFNETPDLIGTITSKNYGEINTHRISQFQMNNEELMFMNKLKIYKSLFTKNNFIKLEDMIDSDTKDNSITYKFNFTFKKYNYHNNKVCYIIRCVDNKNEYGIKYSSSESEGLNIGKKMIANKNKIDCLKNLYKISDNEKNYIFENINEFGSYYYNDSQFQKMYKVYRDYMKKFSRIHGKKKKNNSVLEDENSSQTSATSYNSDLSKINRIFEMKENVLSTKKKISNIYNLIFIIILFILSSALFSFVFFIIVQKIHSGLKLITLLNSKIYYIDLRITVVTSTLISMKTLYKFEKEKEYENYTINTFIKNKNEYFDNLKEKGIYWTTSILEMLNNFEGNLTNAAKKYKINLWEKIPEVYPISFSKKDTETYIRSLMNIIVISHSMFTSDIFHINYNKTIDINQEMELLYISFHIIENNIDFVIPTGLKKIIEILDLFIKFNNEKINNVHYAISIFLFFVFLLEICYLFILIKTNKYIAFGFTKIEKISQENIEMMIQKIKKFSEHYKKRNEVLLSMNDNFPEQNNTVINDGQSQTLSTNNQFKKINSDFGLDTKKNKKLNLLNYNYIHFPLIYIICILVNLILYFICKNAIKSNVSIIKIQTYIFGRFLSVFCSTVYIKCLLAQCNINNTLECDNFLQEDLSFTLFNSLNKFPTIEYFYNEYFLKDACAAFNDKKTEKEKYERCLNNSMVKLINNTNSLLDYIKEKENNLLGEYINNIKLDSSFSSFHVFSSETFRKMEEALYNYVIPVIKKFDGVIIDAFNSFIRNEYNIAIIVISIFLFLVVLFFFYFILFFIKNLEYSIKVSKNIFRITPSIIISSTQDLENWLERINNES